MAERSGRPLLSFLALLAQAESAASRLLLLPDAGAEALGAAMAAEARQEAASKLIRSKVWRVNMATSLG